MSQNNTLRAAHGHTHNRCVKYTKRIHFLTDTTQRKALDAEAKRANESQGTILRRALAAYLASEPLTLPAQTETQK